MPLFIKVDYSMDEQWMMWIKLGVCKLVSNDGNEGSMTEPESKLARKNYRSVLPTQAAKACRLPTNQVNTINHGHRVSPNIPALVRAALPTSWTVEQDAAINATGLDLLPDLGWNTPLAFEAEPVTPVSTCDILSIGIRKTISLLFIVD